MKQLLTGQNLQQMSLHLGTCLKHFLFICDLWPLFVRDKNCKAQRKQKKITFVLKTLEKVVGLS